MAKHTALLAFCDSPTCHTGFGRVAQNILKGVARAFKRIDVWGINYHGQPHELPYRIYPATSGEHWTRAGRLTAFLELLETGNYSHVWLMQDTFNLVNHNFPARLREICRRKGIVSLLYYPVDAALDPAWVEIVRAVQVPVAYTFYGVAETVKALEQGGMEPLAIREFTQRLKVLPHGVDRMAYFPAKNRDQLRATRLRGLPAETLLLLNVNANQRRKDTARSLELLKALKQRGVKCFLIMHMPPTYSDGDVNLEVIGAQLGLVQGKDWVHTADVFQGNIRLLPEEELNVLYNIADLTITTTKGEGWGLSITESVAAGTPVVVPDHTSCAEIAKVLASHEGQSAPVVVMPVEKYGTIDPLDNSRVRPRVDVDKAATLITRLQADGYFAKRRVPLTDQAAWWLSWERICGEWLQLMSREPERQEVTVPLQETGIGRHYYMEIWGGLGDAFNRLQHEGAWQKLAALEADELVTIALMSNNPHTRELFTSHPKFNQMRLLEFGYWQPAEFKAKKREHGLPPAGTQPMPKGVGPFRFEATRGEVSWMRCRFEKLFGSGERLDAEELASAMAWTVLVSPAAGLKDKDIPHEWMVKVCELLRAEGFKLIQIGRNYKRFDRTEPDLGELVDLNLVDQLDVTTTAWLVQMCGGVVTPHSALNILAWHLRKPQLLIYQPQAVRHLQAKDRYGFGVDYPEAVCVAASELPNAEEYVAQFAQVLKGEKKEPKQLEAV